MTQARPGDMHLARELISVEQPHRGVPVLLGCVSRGGVLQAGDDISGQHPSGVARGKLVDKQRLVRDFGRSSSLERLRRDSHVIGDVILGVLLAQVDALAREAGLAIEPCC